MGFIKDEKGNWIFIGSKELYDEIQKVFKEYSDHLISDYLIKKDKKKKLLFVRRQS